MTLHTTQGEVYRSLIESTAFGARMILERFMEYGIKAERVVNCGGIATKNALVMQIFADVMGRPMEVSRSAQTCALGAAIAGAVVAGTKAGGYSGFAEAVEEMTGVQSHVYRPAAANVAVYNKLFGLYRKLHDSFGTRTYTGNLFGVMKELLEIRDKARS
jgi:L-ribulokinase